MNLIQLQHNLPLDSSLIIDPRPYGWVCGGAARSLYLNQKIRDVDIFFPSAKYLHEFKSRLRPEIKITESRYAFNSYHNGQKIQFIKNFYSSSIEDTLDRFDFTVCQFAYDGKNLWATKEALRDCTDKKLIVHCQQYGGGWYKINRILKYMIKGYKCDKTIWKEARNAFIYDSEKQIFCGNVSH